MQYTVLRKILQENLTTIMIIHCLYQILSSKSKSEIMLKYFRENCILFNQFQSTYFQGSFFYKRILLQQFKYNVSQFHCYFFKPTMLSENFQLTTCRSVSKYLLRISTTQFSADIEELNELYFNRFRRNEEITFTQLIILKQNKLRIQFFSSRTYPTLMRSKQNCREILPCRTQYVNYEIW